MAEIKPTNTPNINPNTTDLIRGREGSADKPADNNAPPRSEESTKQAPRHGVQQMRTGYGIVPARGAPPEFSPDGTRTQMLPRNSSSPQMAPGTKMVPKPPTITGSAEDELNTTLMQVVRADHMTKEEKAGFVERTMLRWSVYLTNLEKGQDNVDEK